MILGFILMVLVLGFGLIISLTKFVFGAVFGVIGAIIGTVVLVFIGLNLMFAFIPIVVIVFLILCCRKLIK
ncbi:hypothetical protein [Clostridium folliculivorans]|uniref:Uncharacterized protein n=2 Tax=Clostridium folliculivorans TaxID=2886038 RepID=A0A9W6D9T6_9CLOT|nr:hypothetical protein [Clostridium folliculivorans]GKU24690.1 hypothetical protein CFOLD11_15160 [Clostridium folliculivorans]GKU30788.1 hypothetical protein CFB3_28950 [Clostridium folliculivorans]